MEETQMKLELGHIRLILQKYQEQSLLRDAPLVTFWSRLRVAQSRLRPRLPREICFFFLIFRGLSNGSDVMTEDALLSVSSFSAQ